MKQRVDKKEMPAHGVAIELLLDYPTGPVCLYTYAFLFICLSVECRAMCGMVRSKCDDSDRILQCDAYAMVCDHEPIRMSICHYTFTYIST